MAGRKDLLTADNALIQDIRRMIDKTRVLVASAVNTGLTKLYWKIGKRIHLEILKGDRADYGKQILATLSQQLSWSHFRELLPLEMPLQRDFYAEMCRVERWSVRTLRRKIDSMLYERTAISRKPEAVIRHEIDALRQENRLTPDLVFKDPYFLDVRDRNLEKDLEDAILRETV